MLHFESPQYALPLALSVLLALLVYIWVARQMRQRRAAWSRQAWTKILPEQAPWKSKLKLGLFCLGLLALGTALINPRAGSITQTVKRQGIDVVLALDISRSMLAEDVKPNRMERARQFALKYVETLGGDRVGLIIFAGQAYLQMPMTTDYAAASMFLRTVGPNLELAQGTAMEEVYALAANLKEQDRKSKQKALIFITDGENHESGLQPLAAAAKSEGVSSFVLTVGLPEGAKIPLRELNGGGYHRNKDGQEVISKMNLPLMQEIAQAGGGQVFDLSALGNDKAIRSLEKELGRLEKEEFEQQAYDSFETYFQWFVALTLVLLVLEQLFTYRQSLSQEHD